MQYFVRKFLKTGPKINCLMSSNSLKKLLLGNQPQASLNNNSSINFFLGLARFYFTQFLLRPRNFCPLLCSKSQYLFTWPNFRLMQFFSGNKKCINEEQSVSSSVKNRTHILQVFFTRNEFSPRGNLTRSKIR